MDNSVFSKNGVLTDGLERRYVINTFERKLDLDSVTPIELVLLVPSDWNKSITSECKTINPQVVRFKQNSWNNLLKDLITYLQNGSPKTREELLNFKLDWSYAKVFRETKDIYNMVKLDNGLFFSLNHSANHSQWLIHELITFYEINYGQLLVHRPPLSEPKEVTDYVKESRISGFKSYLIDNKNLSEEKAEKIISVIDKVFNKALLKLYKCKTAYNDFFLFDNVTLLSNFKSKFLEGALYKLSWNDGQIKTAKKYLDYLTDYYTVLKKNARNNKEELELQIYVM